MAVEVPAEETSKRWPILVSWGLCIFAFLFCLISFMYRDKNFYGILVLHNKIALFLFFSIFKLIYIPLIIWFAGCLYLVRSAQKNWLEATLILFFTTVLFAFGLLIAIFQNFTPVDSKLIENRSYNLTYYFDSDGGNGIYELFECNFVGLACKSIHQTELLYEDKPTGILSVNDIAREVSIVINGEIVYSHSVE